MIQVWAEGWAANEGQFRAKKIYESATAETFDDAVREYVETLDEGDRRLVVYRDGFWREWGCRLFDNRRDAQEMFG